MFTSKLDISAKWTVFMITRTYQRLTNNLELMYCYKVRHEIKCNNACNDACTDEDVKM